MDPCTCGTASHFLACACQLPLPLFLSCNMKRMSTWRYALASWLENMIVIVQMNIFNLLCIGGGDWGIAFVRSTLFRSDTGQRRRVCARAATAGRVGSAAQLIWHNRDDSDSRMSAWSKMLLSPSLQPLDHSMPSPMNHNQQWRIQK